VCCCLPSALDQLPPKLDIVEGFRLALTGVCCVGCASDAANKLLCCGVCCREDWLAQLIAELDDTDSYEFVKHLTDVHRLHLFDIVMQYRAIFFDSSAQVRWLKLLCADGTHLRFAGMSSGAAHTHASAVATCCSFDCGAAADLYDVVKMCCFCCLRILASLAASAAAV
jgi:hypothetical protein